MHLAAAHRALSAAHAASPPTRFGREAVSDPRFVFDLRNGRELREKTVDARPRLARRAGAPAMSAGRRRRS